MALSLVPLTARTQSCAPTPAGLLAWWPGENTAVDLVAGNNGSAVGNASFASGKVAFAFSFDGNGSGFSVSNSAALQLQNFTIEAWVRRADSSITTLDSDGNGLFFGYGFGGYGFGMNASGHLLLTRVNVDGVNSNLSFTNTVFHHVAVTKSGTNVVFYVDGAGDQVGPYSTSYTFTSTPSIGLRLDALRTVFWGRWMNWPFTTVRWRPRKSGPFSRQAAPANALGQPRHSSVSNPRTRW